MKSNNAIFFFHLPKTGGDTLRGFMESTIGKDLICPDNTWTTALRKGSKCCSNYQVINGHFYGPLEEFFGKPHFCFSLLRDPIARAISHYAHVMRDQSHYLHQHAQSLGSFEAFMKDPVTSMTITNFQSRMLASQVSIETLLKNLGDENDPWALERFLETKDSGLNGHELFTVAKSRLETFELVGVTERLPEFIALLCYRLSWKYPENITDRNVGMSQFNCLNMPAMTRTKLEQMNETDIELYDMAKQKFEATFTYMLKDLINRRSSRSWLRSLIDL